MRILHFHSSLLGRPLLAVRALRPQAQATSRFRGRLEGARPGEGHTAQTTRVRAILSKKPRPGQADGPRPRRDGRSQSRTSCLTGTRRRSEGRQGSPLRVRRRALRHARSSSTPRGLNGSPFDARAQGEVIKAGRASPWDEGRRAPRVTIPRNLAVRRARDSRRRYGEQRR